MLDYEIIKYIVEYEDDEGTIYEFGFYSEEKAIRFIKENRYQWQNYKLTKVQQAVIDF